MGEVKRLGRVMLLFLTALGPFACGDDDDDGRSKANGGMAGAATTGGGEGGEALAGARSVGGGPSDGGMAGGETTTGGTAAGGTAAGGDVSDRGGAVEGGGGTVGGGAPPTGDEPYCGAQLDRTVTTSIDSLATCLFSGTGAPQTGVTRAAIDPERVAIVRGRVLDRAGQALGAVRVSALGHPEWGSTVTRDDGYFDFAINGGGDITLRYELPDYLKSQRRVHSQWRRFAHAPDVVLVAQGEPVEPVALGTPGIQVIEAASNSDESGTRSEVLMFQAGASARAIHADGSEEALSSLHLRVTEFTVGAAGPQAMPSDLPPDSAYTYAVDYSADEVRDSDGARIELEPPVIGYLDNFLAFPAGTVVPLGSYDTASDTWKAEANGVVLDIVSVTDGVAGIDANGDGEADSAGQLEDLGITLKEQQALALRYEPGSSLWRRPISHFSIWDANWGTFPPSDATPPPPEAVDTPVPQDCKTSIAGSIIGCEDQSLGEVLKLPGTPFYLQYQSDRARGGSRSNSLRIALAGASIPASLLRIDLEVAVAGQLERRSYAPKANLEDVYEWDGTDAHGRLLQGQQPATIRIGYAYAPVYQETQTFGAEGNRVALTGDPARSELVVWRSYEASLGQVDAAALGFAGWSLNAQHLYDGLGRTLYLGNGQQRAARSSQPVITTAIGANLAPGGQLVAASDGSLFVAGSEQIVRRAPDGTLEPYAGSGKSTQDGVNGENGPALEANLSVLGIALRKDGALFFTDSGSIRTVLPDGTLRTIAGGAGFGCTGDGGPALDATFFLPRALAFAPDGSLFVADGLCHLVRRIAPDGTITSRLSGNVTSLAATANGDLLASSAEGIVRSREGAIDVIAGFGKEAISDGMLATDAKLDLYTTQLVPKDDGSLFFTEGSGLVLELKPDGHLHVVAGGGEFNTLGDNGPPTQTYLGSSPGGLALGPDGSLYVSEGTFAHYSVRKIAPAWTGFGSVNIPSEDGTSVYVFDEHGRHLSTLDSLSGAALVRFDYDEHGLLTRATDVHANSTTFQRTALGELRSVTGPFGDVVRFGLNDEGYLASATNANDETTGYEYGNGGLLTSVTSPRSPEDIRTFVYDERGALIKDTSANGPVRAIEHAALANGGQRVTVSSALGRQQVHDVLDDAFGTHRRIVAPDGVSLQVDAAGPQVVSSSALRTEQSVSGPDPRFGMLAPITTRVETRLANDEPASPTVERAREVTLSDPADPLTVETLTDTVRVGGRAWKKEWDAATRTLTSTSPQGRTQTQIFDEKGQLIRARRGSLSAIGFEHDARGRLSQLGNSRGTTRFEYGKDGRLSRITNALDQQWTVARDPVGRITSVTLPDESIQRMAYDANGNLTSLTPPGSAAHTQTFSGIDVLTSYVPPKLGGSDDVAMRYAYDADGALATATVDGGGAVASAYDAKTGRLRRVTTDGQATAYAYDATTGLLASVSSGSQTIELGYSGTLPTRLDWSGDIAASVSRTLDTQQRIATETAAGAAIAFSYDDDDLLTSAGAETLTASADSGLLTRSVLGTVSEQVGRDDAGKLSTLTSTTGQSALASFELERDALGRVVKRTEKLLGESHEQVFEYDARGRLTSVLRDGAPSESYEYDSNGNRTRAVNASGSRSAVYDAQDRLSANGDETFTYTAAGSLSKRTRASAVTTYDYASAGALRGVVLAGGKRIDYVLDPVQRRTGKKVAGELVSSYLYRTALPTFNSSGALTAEGFQLAAELTASGSLRTRFVYATKSHVPDYMVRAGVTYRLLSDERGSVRLVVNTANGAVAQRLDYDTWGNVTRDSAPGFQPFGFAGGLYDPDTGLVRFGARDYDPSSGRFTSKDPLGFKAGANFFAYAGNDPVNRIDPTGLKDWTEAEVEQLLESYAALLDNAHYSKYWTMLGKHCGACEYDFYQVAEFDTFAVRGHGVLRSEQFGNYIAGFAAGYLDDATAYWLVRGAGSLYGFGAYLNDLAPAGDWEYLGDNYDSVLYIDLGTLAGWQLRDQLARENRPPATCK